MQASMMRPQRSLGAPQRALRSPAAAFGRAARPARRAAAAVVHSLAVKDKDSGVEFPLGQTFWEGQECHCLGSGTRSKKILMVGVKVYTVALYAEGERAAKELGVRYRGGFFENDGDFCAALVDGAFGKALVLQLLRDVTGEQFSDAIGKTLAPRMQLTGETAAYDQFISFFTGRQLPSGIKVIMWWSVKGELQLATVAPGTDPDLRTMAPEMRVASPGLARALFEIFLGQNSVVAPALPVFAAGARELLDSENVKRETRKPI